MKRQTMIAALVLVSVMGAYANQVNPLQPNPLADLPWQNYNYAYNYPWQGYNLTQYWTEAEGTAVAQPTSPGTLFASINWYQPLDNPNVGSSLEYLREYMGVVWWDFAGGHHVMDSHLQWHLNEALPLRLNYVEVTSGWPGPSINTWYKPPTTPYGLVQYEMPPASGGWVTHVNFYTSSVPESGSTIALMVVALMAIACRRLVSWK